MGLKKHWCKASLVISAFVTYLNVVSFWIMQNHKHALQVMYAVFFKYCISNMWHFPIFSLHYISVND